MERGIEAEEMVHEELFGARPTTMQIFPVAVRRGDAQPCTLLDATPKDLPSPPSMVR